MINLQATLQQIAADEKKMMEVRDRSSITYTDFVKKVLPNLARIKDGEFDAIAWIEVTGHPSVGLDVIDEQTGNVRYELPPLLASDDLAASEELHLASEMVEARQLYQDSPRYAEEKIYRALSAFQVERDLTPTQTKNLQILNRVLADHKLPTLGGDSATSAATPVDVVDDIVGYDLP